VTVNTSLVRECLELILMLADALDRKQTKPPSTVSRQSLPVTPKVAPVVLGSETLEGVRVFACAFQLAWLRTLPGDACPSRRPGGAVGSRFVSARSHIPGPAAIGE
jgi:hypothetical protein